MLPCVHIVSDLCRSGGEERPARLTRGKPRDTYRRSAVPRISACGICVGVSLRILPCLGLGLEDPKVTSEDPWVHLRIIPPGVHCVSCLLQGWGLGGTL